MIEDTPTVKIRSASSTPGSVNVPRSVVPVPMCDTESTVLGRVSVSVSILSGTSVVSDEEEVKEEDERCNWRWIHPSMF